MPKGQIDCVDMAVTGQENGLHADGEERVVVSTFVDELKLLNADIVVSVDLLEDPALLVGVGYFFFDKSQQIKVAPLDEGVDFEELVEQEDDLLAVQLQLDVGHHKVDCGLAPFEDRIVFVYGNALFVEQEDQAIPGKPALLQLHILA